MVDNGVLVDGLLTPPEAAARLRISLRTFYTYVAAGSISVVRLPSGHIRVRVADLDAAVTLSQRTGN